ncbi:hypothetical protein [Alicyclobacillus fodiniaquatilis]|uniref:Uncharacterized protein n=1 Tax=Alicyclobacillus fodiniaquatilis TaxID=1661150 RepID=A0ABW4JHF8_9BACL
MSKTNELLKHISSLKQSVDSGDLEFAILRVGGTDITLQPTARTEGAKDAKKANLKLV